ncbi:MAG: FAD-dependent oxidoreductase, partial [Thermocrispum sp.]
FSVRVLDRADHIGGMSSSFEVAGMRVDHGSHRLHPNTPPRVLQDLQTLLGEELQTRARNGRLRIGDRWLSYPLRPVELARRLPAHMTAGVARDTVAAPLRRARRDTYAERVRAGLGPTVYDAVYGPYAEKLWGLPGTQIAGEQARRRVTGNSPWKVAGRVLRGGRTSSLGGQGKVFHYPRRGFGQICERLGDAATDAGAEIVLGADVERLVPSFEDVRVYTRDAGESEAGIAFSTLPLPLLARITSPGPPMTAIEAASRLRFRAMVLVYVVHKEGRWTSFDAHYLPGAYTPVTRISEPANYRESAADPTDLSVVCAEIPCAVGDEIWTADHDALAALVEEAVDRSGLPPLRRADVEVRRLPFVYPVYEVGFERRLAGIEAWITGVPQVVSFGRLGLFAHDNSHHAMLEAYEAVDTLGLDGSFDTARWRVQRERFAEHVVED